MILIFRHRDTLKNEIDLLASCLIVKHLFQEMQNLSWIKDTISLLKYSMLDLFQIEKVVDEAKH